jgi:hypothetical protein
MFGRKPSPGEGDPVAKLMVDVEKAAESLSRAVGAARAGARGVSYEDWFLIKKINEGLFRVRMQVISMEP